MSNRKFGQFGGQYVPETIMSALHELEEAYGQYKNDPAFLKEYRYYLKQYVGRPSPLYFAEGLTRQLGGARIYLKREDLNHTGAHKINNVMGQLLLAKRMGKTKVIAETGAGQHGVATATGAALLNMECTVYMGQEDIERQALNVFRMELLGATVQSVTSGTATLKDATNEAIRSWIHRVEDTFYVIGSVVGPAPYPEMVREFQKVIGEEAREQILQAEGKLPDAVVACVGGGSNAMGIFHAFVEDEKVDLIGVEGAGKGVGTGLHAAAIAEGKVGVLHGMKTFLLQDDYGNITPAYSVSAGLDYPGIGPEHAALHESQRATYVSVTDEEAIEALSNLCVTDGILPALESAHALAYVKKIAPEMSSDQVLVVNLSGRGDKDVHTIAAYMKGEHDESD